jgi:hypothetical protein
MEQFAILTFDLLQTQGQDIRFAAWQLQGAVEVVVKMFLNIPDTPWSNTHSSYLAPYYSLAKSQTLGEQLADLCNALLAAEKDDKAAAHVIDNIEVWAEKLYVTEKKLLLLAVEKRSHFTFDMLHWIAHIAKLLTAVAQAPATGGRLKGELEKHASWLIYVLSWIPDNEETTSFVATFSMTELLFGAAMEALIRNGGDVAEATRRVLVRWAFNAGRHATGWAILEQSLLGLATLVLWKEELGLFDWLKEEIAKRLGDEAPPSQELRDGASRELDVRRRPCVAENSN